MTLRMLIAAHPDSFYEQGWYLREAFMDREPDVAFPMPVSIGVSPADMLPGAIELALLYIEHSSDPMWERFLWTNDFDDLGQRIYVGGIGQAKKPGFQIHRHLEVTELWGWPTW